MTANSLALISTDSISNLSTESNSEIQIFKESQLDVLQELLDFIDEYLIINKAISTKAKKVWQCLKLTLLMLDCRATLTLRMPNMQWDLGV